ncbi:unnamed protein product [Adineta ricciae]|uniref:LicD/FKTN/FKRP nucleotidyltransferase domain-containing protein n=1 Tax=Adineta ricciae TaxID=249248 RepID=A0A814Y2A0_ADIRI|nr:unnamed protein product [Adineta ricciae]
MNFSSSIRSTLEQIPTCNLKDRPRQEVLLTTLYAWTQLAREHNIQYWIAYGSLVGYVQRRGLLPHDQDTDILMLSQDTRHLVPFADTNFSSIYELKVHPQWHYIGYAGRSYYPEKGFNFIAPNARFIHRKLRYHVDIWPIYDFHPDRPKNRTNVTTALTEYDVSYRWISSPIEWTFPLTPCNFSSILVWCPAKPESIVANLYGQSAVTKTNKKCVNQTWVSA